MKEEIEWFYVEDKMPDDGPLFEDNTWGLIFDCLCQVVYQPNHNDKIDPNDDPGIIQLNYITHPARNRKKVEKFWALNHKKYDWGWKVIAWALMPKGPELRRK